MQNWAIVRKFLEEFIRNKSEGYKNINNLIIACEEIYMNISKYAYSGCHKPLDIQCEYSESKNEFLVKFTDHGVEFDPTKIEKAKTNIPLEEREIGGLGILIAKKLSSSMHYKRLEGENILNLSFK